MCRRRSDCRLCGSGDLLSVLKLEPTPPANAFVDSNELGKEQEKYPLELFFCQDCGHVQLRDVVDPSLLFENYVYVSGTSPVFVQHFERYAQDVVSRFHPQKDQLVVDIGSNDGTLLGFFKRQGYPVLGIDPAREVAETATRAGIETLTAFVKPRLADQIRSERGPCGVVTANNVFAHIDDLGGVLDSVGRLLAPGGIFVFEVSYLVDVYEKTLFDTIYHEHLAYHTVKPLIPFFESRGMALIDVERIATHGGSIRGTAQLAGGPHPVASSVQSCVDLEQKLGLDRADTFKLFARNIDVLKNELGSLFKDLKAAGKTIAGFGAPAKATTLMHHFHIGPEIVDFVVDDSPWKQGLFTPGMHIPVLPSRALYERQPDYVVILAWNFAAPIMEKHSEFRNSGGRFVVPLPKVEVH